MTDDNSPPSQLIETIEVTPLPDYPVTNNILDPMGMTIDEGQSLGRLASGNYPWWVIIGAWLANGLPIICLWQLFFTGKQPRSMAAEAIEVPLTVPLSPSTSSEDVTLQVISIAASILGLAMMAVYLGLLIVMTKNKIIRSSMVKK